MCTLYFYFCIPASALTTGVWFPPTTVQLYFFHPPLTFPSGNRRSVLISVRVFWCGWVCPSMFFASTIHLRCRLCQQEKRDLEFRYLVMVFTRFLNPFLSSVEDHTRTLLEIGVRTITCCKLQPPLFCPDAERYSHALCMQRLCIPPGGQWPSI